ncbi:MULTISPECIES: hypothetical protein [Derxia]|uniref:Uncharacterized protein n=1 Tax=Derxia gummosa DSM 723 TaxID=1121388 RepID=A0A8B6X368_9BURK|nr:MULTISPECIES: hypothetical protein [Derxia]
MDGWSKAALTAAAVGLVMAVARRRPALAGLVAALPLVTAPTLAWIALDHGAAFAVHAAVGSVAACALLAAFALGYGLMARRGGVTGALLGGLAPTAALLPVALGAGARLDDALLLALGCTLVAELMLARLGARAGRPAGSDARAQGPEPPIRASEAFEAIEADPLPPAPLAPATALSIGAFAALADAAGPALGGFATGLLASLPIVGATMVVREHSRRGQGAARLFLRGYVRGLVGKAGFGAVFALGLPVLGLAATLGLACAACWAAAWPTLRRGRRPACESRPPDGSQQEPPVAVKPSIR